MQFQAENRGLRELSYGAPDALALATYAREQIAPVVTELLTSTPGRLVRPDVTEQDLALVPIMIGAIIRSTQPVDPGL